MMEKKYSTGFIVGRFQMFHKGHMSLIDLCRQNAKNVIVLVGSSDKERTKDNPFSFQERKQMIQYVYKDVTILPLPDIGVGDVPLWGDYLFRTIREKVGSDPDVYVCGKENKVDHWFDEEKRKKLTIVRIDRDKLPVSATLLREYLKENKKEEWSKYVSEKLFSKYDEYRNILLSIK